MDISKSISQNIISLKKEDKFNAYECFESDLVYVFHNTRCIDFGCALFNP